MLIAALRVTWPPLPGTLDMKGVALSEAILARMPDHGTLWNWRREGLGAVLANADTAAKQALMDKEFSFLNTCLERNPKSYGVWYQRRWAMQNAPRAPWSGELANCSKFLTLDARNFHCWDYRRFVASGARAAGCTEASEEAEFE